MPLDPKLDPRKRFDLVKDPVHGYIPFTKDKLLCDEETTEDVIYWTLSIHFMYSTITLR